MVAASAAAAGSGPANGSASASDHAGSSESRAPLLIAQYIPNSSLAALQASSARAIQQQQQRQQQQAQNQLRAHTPSGNPRRSPIPPPGGLAPLPEASHVNALNSASGPSPLGLPPNAGSATASQLDADVDAAVATLTPPQRAASVSRAEGYDRIAVDITNERWKERWEYLCLASPDPASSYDASAADVAANGGGGSSGAAANGRGNANGGSGNYGSLAAWEAGGKQQHQPPSGGGGGGGLTRSSSRGHGDGVSAAWRERDRDQQGGGLHAHANATAAASASSTFQMGSIQEHPDESEGGGVEESANLREAELWRRAPCFKRGEVNVTRLDETDGLIAFASPWLELDAADEGVRLDSEIALRQELQYAAYLGISHVVLPPPSSDPAHRPFLVDYARAINACLVTGGAESAAAGAWMTVSVRLPVSSPHQNAQNLLRQKSGVPASGSASSTGSGTATPTSKLPMDEDWAWETWETIRSVCGYSRRLSIALDLSVPLTSSASLARWNAEPVSSIVIPAASFLSNAKGFPVLSKACQAFLKTLFKRRPAVILAGTQSPPPQHTRGGATAYLQYVRHLERTMPAESAVEVFARGYTDYLQMPLQPLHDHLESQTYDVFERDPVKYALYEEAIFQALCERPASAGVASIWVCGAGRGPLVSRCLAAADRARVPVHVTAVEKNPGAMVTLQERLISEWGEERVRLCFGDMRQLERPRREADRADIVVSELLGSFGDNELSPECLDGAMRFLKPEGISIPSSYAPFLTPLSSPKLHAEVLNQASGAGASSGAASAPPSTSSGALADRLTKAAETPYVVLFESATLLAGHGGRGGWEKVQECWLFEHAPVEQSGTIRDERELPLTNSHNVRESSHTFSIPTAGVCHGLAGYFEAHLYGDVRLSIHPDPQRASKDMLSWFPVFFPFKEPMYLPAGAELDVYLWRFTGGAKVWYEWCAESYLPIPPLAVPGGATMAAAAAAALTASGPHRVVSGQSESGSADGSVVGGLGGGGGGGALMLRGASNSVGSSATGGTTAGVGGTSAGTMAAPTGPSIVQPPARGLQAGWSRVKIGMTPIMNPAGRSSWVAM